jgi:hypothetical protein
MKSWMLLRIAAIMTVLYCAGHTMGMPWTPSTGPKELAVIEAMKSNRFDVMGSARTYWDFYLGFGLIISGYLALQAIVLWQLATLAKNDWARARPIVLVFFIFSIVNAALVWSFFFIVPLVLATAIAVCLGLPFLSAKPR